MSEYILADQIKVGDSLSIVKIFSDGVSVCHHGKVIDYFDEWVILDTDPTLNINLHPSIILTTVLICRS